MAHTRVSLPDRTGFALLSDDELTDTAIVYVHGFWGGAEGTWENIVYYVDMLHGDPFARSDLFFFDYPAEKDFLNVSAASLRRFIRQVYPLASEDLFSVSLRDIDWRYNGGEEVRLQIRDVKPYNRAILVGHSLGAVVIRRLIADEIFDLQDAATIRQDSILAAELRLFAPAHVGFRPAALKKVLWSAPVVGPILHAVAMGANRAFQDLVEGCDALAQLRRETERAALTFPMVESLKPYVIWGRREDIVAVGRYDSDPPSRVEDVPEKDHMEVCKIRFGYDRAAYFINPLARKTSA